MNLIIQQAVDTIVDVHRPKFFGRNSNTDSLALVEKDTFRIETRTEFYPDSVSLKLFVNQIHTQSIRARSRISPFLYALGFSLPVDLNSLCINSNQYNSQAYSFEILPSQDSVLIWLLDTALINDDSTQLFINHTHKGIECADTIILMKNKEMPARLEFTSSHKSLHTVFPSDSIVVHANRPLATIHTHAQVFSVTDTLALQDMYGKFIDTANLKDIYAHQIAPPKRQFEPKYFYDSQEIIGQRLGNGRFALYFSKPFDTSEISIRLAEYPDLQNWYCVEVDSESNALLCWITDERVAVLKNPIITVTYLNGDIEKQQRISFSPVFEQTERYRNYRYPRLLPVVREEQKKELYVHTAIEVICNNPIQDFSDSLFLLYDVNDSLLQNCITKIERSSSSPRTIHIFHTAEVGKNYILTLQKNAVYDVYGDGNKEFSTTIATQKFSQSIQYTPVPCEYVLHPNNRTYSVTANWKPNTKYKLILPYAAAEDVYGAVSDSLCIDISCPKSESYGSLVIDVDSLDSQKQYVFELRKKGAAKTEGITHVYRYPEPIVFANVTADEYTLSCVIDTNGNGIWDTGSLEEKRQAETRLFFPKKIQIKANWENRINWNIQK